MLLSGARPRRGRFQLYDYVGDIYMRTYLLPTLVALVNCDTPGKCLWHETLGQCGRALITS
jgi:hypothetical protein